MHDKSETESRKRSISWETDKLSDGQNIYHLYVAYNSLTVIKNPALGTYSGLQESRPYAHILTQRGFHKRQRISRLLRCYQIFKEYFGPFNYFGITWREKKLTTMMLKSVSAFVLFIDTNALRSVSNYTACFNMTVFWLT